LCFHFFITPLPQSKNKNQKNAQTPTGIMISTKKQFHLLGENQRQSSPSLTNQTLVQTKFGSTDVSSRTKDGIARNAVTEAYKKNNYKVTFGKRLNKNFAVEGSYTNYSSDAEK
jgi:hypothetical protein